MFERFTGPARAVVGRARREARDLRHPYIGTEHLLLALVSEEGGVAYGVLHQAGLDAARVRADIERLVAKPAKILTDDDAAALRTIGIDLDAVLARIEESFGPDAPHPPASRRRRWWLVDGTRFSQRARKVLELALREAVRLHDNVIGTEHLLLGLVREGNGLAAKILTDAGLDLADLRRATLARRGKAA
jgi:ATP-dependent Clp protease ATP-binding subunit ClpA